MIFTQNEKSERLVRIPAVFLAIIYRFPPSYWLNTCDNWIFRFGTFLNKNVKIIGKT